MRNRTTSGGYKIIQVLSGRSNVFLLNNRQSNILVDTGPGFMWGIQCLEYSGGVFSRLLHLIRFNY